MRNKLFFLAALWGCMQINSGMGQPFDEKKNDAGGYDPTEVPDSVSAEKPASASLQQRNAASTFSEGIVDYITPRANAVVTKTYFDYGQSYTDVAYFNGLGAPCQTIRCGASKDGTNLVEAITYDEMYRANAKVLLPFPVNMYSGERVEYPEQVHKAYYSQRKDNPKDNSAFTTNVFDKSGLDRIRYSYRPGDIYRQNAKFAEYRYETNTEADKVFGFKPSVSLLDGWYTYYVTPGTLLKNTVIDEDGNKTVQFVNADDKVVLERRFLEYGESANTYYIYDPYFGRLEWVITPESSCLLVPGRDFGWNSFQEDKYCYRYEYDGRGNMIYKRRPGQNGEHFVYDNSNRIVFSQDGNLNDKERWFYYVYDNHGNLLRKNLVATDPYNTSSLALQRHYDAGHNNRFPHLGGTTDMDVPFPDDRVTLDRKLIENIYGNVDYTYSMNGFVEIPWTAPSDMTFLTDTDYPAAPLQKPTGLKTYEKLAVLEEGDTAAPAFVERTYYYDYKNRPIQIVERNRHGGISRTYYAYDIPGNILRSKEVHQLYPGMTPDVLTRACSYDVRRRMTEETWTLNGKSETTEFSYNDLGQLEEKVSRNGAIEISMSYNLQGWLTSLTSHRFSQTLAYESPVLSVSTPSYTGNISEITWQHEGDPAENTYSCLYDELSRFTGATQSVDGVVTNQFVENYLTYDLNGNFKRLDRMSNGDIENVFLYTYTGNQLTELRSVQVGRPSSFDLKYEYAYDKNGNMVYDGLNALDMKYNHLNLIQKINQNNFRIADYSYLADGTKISTMGENGDILEYQGSLIYKTCGDGLILESIPLFDGRFVTTTEGIDVQYFIKDHLGSVRVVLDDPGRILERNDYYPLGMRWSNDSQPISDNRYRYNGKEDQEFAGTPYIDYGARQYDPYVGRWNAVDPLAEKYYPISPYAFCAGNPLKYIDVDGRKIYFAPGVSPEFKDKFAATVQYMNEKGTSGDIAKLQASNNSYYINEAGSIKDTYFSPETNTINWDPDHLIMTDKGILISPATVLAHEADHAQKFDDVIQNQDNTQRQQYNDSVKSDSDNQYSKEEEKRVITGTEQDAARKHGDINKKQTTRENHKGKQANINISNKTPKEISRIIYESNNQFINN